MQTGKDLTGGCRCGAVRYALHLPQLPRACACHCLDCQTWSGSAFSEQFLLREDELSVTGAVTPYEFVNPSGRVSSQRMCPTCHTRIFNTNASRPGIAVVRAGTLDESHTLNLVAHIWVKRKQPWLIIPDGVPTWPEAAPPQDFIAILFS